MPIAVSDRPITAKEFRDEWQRLRRLNSLEANLAREMLMERVFQRDEALFEKFGRTYMDTHYGDWIAIHEDGRIILAKTATEAGRQATETFEPGSFAVRRLNEIGGHQMGF
jgi:hypothetical protein